MNKVLSRTIDHPISIGRNESCPCGSGKKYKNCCYDKNHKFAEFIAPNNQRAIIDSTEKEENFLKLDEYISRNKIYEYYEKGNIIDVGLAINHLGTIYNYFDRLIKPISQISSCKKGCSSCCKIIVSTTAVEAELIRNYIYDRFPMREIRQIYTKIGGDAKEYPKPLGIGENYSDTITDKFLKANIPCPFLTSDNSCLIYEVRPLMCRKYLVFTETKKCKEDDKDIISYKAGYSDYFLENIDALSAITFKDIHYTKHLPSWFLKEGILSRPFKKINIQF